MSWFLVLAIVGVAFIVFGTLIVIATMGNPEGQSGHGWAFIILGIILVVVFGVVGRSGLGVG